MSTPASGFTLVEAVVGLALVSLLTAGTAGLLVTSSRAVRMARLSTSATLLASQKVEQLRDGGAAAGAYEDRVSADGAPAGTAGGAFVRRWTLAPAPGTGPGVMTVRVDVMVAGVGTLAVLHAVIGAVA